MFSGGLLLATTIIAFGVWMQWREQHQAAAETHHSDLDRRYHHRRNRSRRLVHGLFLLTGTLVMVATLAGPARARLWLAMWTTAVFVLLVIVVLAALDALRTHLYQLRKRTELRRQSVHRDSESGG